MTPQLDKLVDSVAVILEDRQPPSEEALLEIVKAQAAVLTLTSGKIGAPFSHEDLAAAVRAVEVRFSIRMSLGSLFEAEDYQPWLIGRQGEIDWFYWERYRKHLLKKGFPPHVVVTLDRLTDKIVDHLGDPLKEGNWARKGLVVGHVQSGKTANYTGLVCKAADAGYRVIIVLAGTLNSLRNQTQERIDADFIGWSTREKRPIGAATFGGLRRPVCFTTSVEDFKKQTANAIAMGLAALNEPVVLVVKKNKATLENLYSWLSDNNQHNLQNFPMLLVDDEADQASINTSKEDRDPTAINLAIRNLLSLFTRSSFVGYTATPFANIFVDPDTEDEMENGAFYRDLFPRDFILSLDPPDNYVGPHRLFIDDADLDCIRDIVDNENLLPMKHKIDFIPEQLPESLQEAICCFFLAITIRLLRGQVGKCHSMMVNGSRFTKVQNFLGGLILESVKQLKQSVANYAALGQNEALQNKDISLLHKVFDKEFASAGFAWPAVQKKLREATDPVELLILNVGSQDTLDYSQQNYPNGRSVIAVGGLGLSRGLTLEGLVTSYFLRNSIMYDTLMQMGRWFGYRDGYADVCRIFMTPLAYSWYSHIADATEELRKDFKAMERAKLTPKEFGLRVRSHPTSLIVTARNKMRTGRKVPMQIALEGRLVETSVLFGDKDILERNKNVLETVCLQSEKERRVQTEPGLGYLWKSVSPSIVLTAVQAFENHPECLLTYADPLVQYIEWLISSSDARFDVLLRSSTDSAKSYDVGALKIAPIKRTVPQLDDYKIEFNKRRVASKGDERAGLTATEVRHIKDGYPGENLPDRLYRTVEGRNPLFMINFADVKTKTNTPVPPKIVPGYGISFPGDSGSAKRPAKLVEYVVNTRWWEQNFDLPEDDPDEE
jgi:Z1 domain-containing protein